MPMPKGGIKAFDDGPERREKPAEDDPRKEAAKALFAALKSGDEARFLEALDSVLDLREPPELEPVEDFEDFDLEMN